MKKLNDKLKEYGIYFPDRFRFWFSIFWLVCGVVLLYLLKKDFLYWWSFSWACIGFGIIALKASRISPRQRGERIIEKAKFSIQDKERLIEEQIRKFNKDSHFLYFFIYPGRIFVYATTSFVIFQAIFGNTDLFFYASATLSFMLSMEIDENSFGKLINLFKGK